MGETSTLQKPFHYNLTMPPWFVPAAFYISDILVRKTHVFKYFYEDAEQLFKFGAEWI
uniref:Uncharacterized protein n=1 Tax=Anguilla anguilla TaxID=7936 RepID=A0A0E9WCJ5_ANGAN